MSFLKIFLLLFVINLKSQSEISNQKFKLEIEIQNIKNDGDMYFALYDNDENFTSPNESTDLMLLAIKEKVFVNNHRMNIFLAKGNYAIKIYIDKNYNEKFDFNFFGFPKEQYGFSNNATGILGPPDFKASSFQVKNDSIINIKMK
tara:strand:+ start:72 stop:509 length:438 start_codon:yes stop_codon:yes gene_type:complete